MPSTLGWRVATSPPFSSRRHEAASSTIRVRVGGIPDARDDNLQAYVLVGFGRQPPMASRPLPHVESALLLQHQWQQRTFEYDPYSSIDANQIVSLEVMAWRPNSGERSLGRVGIHASQVAAVGRWTLRGPLGLLIEINHFNSLERDPELQLAGSGVRCVITDENDSQRSRHRMIWRAGDAPSPSKPLTVNGMPPTTPPGPGMEWVWGATQWHAVPMSTDASSQLVSGDEIASTRDELPHHHDSEPASSVPRTNDHLLVRTGSRTAAGVCRRAGHAGDGASIPATAGAYAGVRVFVPDPFD